MTGIPKPSSPNYRQRYPVSCSYKQGQALRVSWKNHPRPEACGIFPANLACTGHDLLWPVVTGTPAPKSRITKNKLLCHSR